MEWDDYLRQQAATYRQLAEKAEDAVVKKELLDFGRRLRRGRQQHRGSSYKRVNGMSRFRTRLEGLDFNLHPTASEEANGVLLDGNGNIVRER